jgi:hypothetical protein
MQAMNLANPLHQECLANLQKILHLAMQTAEAASADGNHRLTLQAVREVTRIVTLMTKLDGLAVPDDAKQPLICHPPAEPLESVSPAAPSLLRPEPFIKTSSKSGKSKKAGRKNQKKREQGGNQAITDQIMDDLIMKFNLLDEYEKNAVSALVAEASHPG